MAWARLDDNVIDHPKTSKLSNTAWRLWASALVYSNKHTLDGVLPAYVLAGLNVRGNIKPAIAELTTPHMPGANPLWRKVDGGYQVHDYFEKNRNMSRAQIETAKANGHKGGRPRVNQTTVDTIVVTTVDTTAVPAVGPTSAPYIPSPPLPSPPIPSEETSSLQKKEKTAAKNAAEAPEGFENFWSLYPRKTGKGAAEKSWRKLHPSAALQLAIFNAVREQIVSVAWTKDGGEFIPLPATWLNQGRWADEVFVPKPTKGRTGTTPGKFDEYDK